ncbi:MAG TPA: MMPL family transporter [Thermoleophilaceae bacterium]
MARRGQVVDEAEQQTAAVGELIGIAVAVLVLTLVFRSAAAMLLTLFASLLALAGGIMLLTLGSAVLDFPSFAPTLGVMLGLGAGIDYALLIVGRYREQLATGDDVPHAARVANQTAGTSIVAAGSIVVVAITGLLATGLPFVGRMGLGSAILVATVALGAVTVLPVLMGAFARRLRPRRQEHVAPSAAFSRWGSLLTRRPWVAAGAGALILVVLATPFASLRLGQPDDGNDPTGTTTRAAYDKLAEGFGPGFNGPLVLAASVPEGRVGQAALARVERAVARTPDVAAVAPAQLNRSGDAATINVIPKSSPQDERTSKLVDRLRNDVLPAATAGTAVDVYVGGATAIFEDLADKIASRLPVFIALVVGRSVILLMAVVRSIWVPLVSAAFNLHSILAAYGVVVAVFQNGWGSSLLGVDGEVPIVSFVPLFMFAILFGLSMDYNVFLQSRIREEYHRGAHASRQRGARTRPGRADHPGRGGDHGLGLPRLRDRPGGGGQDHRRRALRGDPDRRAGGAADRRPAVIALLGDRAWGVPRRLDRILPRISLEGGEHHAPPRPQPAAAEAGYAGRRRKRAAKKAPRNTTVATSLMRAVIIAVGS